MRGFGRERVFPGNDGFKFDYDHNVIFNAGHIIPLSPHEADVFRVLLDNRARPTPISVLIQKVYGVNEPESAAVSVRVAIHSLRKKLQETAITIRAEPKVGYEIDVSHAPELNRGLNDNILIALNLARATDEYEIAAQLAAALALAEVSHRRRGSVVRNIMMAEAVA